MSFETTIRAFAAALGEPSAPPPAMTHGRMGAPDARRFAVYRNNVAVGLIGALEARYPVSRRIAGDELFRAMARAFVRAHKPRSPVMIAYGGEFPNLWPIILRRLDGSVAAASSRLPDVARLENAWVEAYHAEDASAGDGRRPRRAQCPIVCARNADRLSPRRAPPALRDAGRFGLGLRPELRQPAAPPGDRRRRAHHAPRLRRPRARPAAARLRFRSEPARGRDTGRSRRALSTTRASTSAPIWSDWSSPAPSPPSSPGQSS